MAEKTKVIITVGCEYGCHGPAIAQKMADDFGIPCYDRDLIDDIIEEAGFSKDLLDKAEKGHAIRGRDTDQSTDPKKLGAIRYHNLTDRVVFLQRETVRRLAARGSCVFVGRCADHILRHADVKTLRERGGHRHDHRQHSRRGCAAIQRPRPPASPRVNHRHTSRAPELQKGA